MILIVDSTIKNSVSCNVFPGNMDEDSADVAPRNLTHHGQSALSLFPSTLLSSSIQLIALLDDAAVSEDGNAVYEMAYQVKSSMIQMSFFLPKSRDFTLTRERPLIK